MNHDHAETRNLLGAYLLGGLDADDRATFENPVQTPVGIMHVIVNGTPVVRDGAVTGAHSGRALRHVVR